MNRTQREAYLAAVRHGFAAPLDVRSAELAISALSDADGRIEWLEREAKTKQNSHATEIGQLRERCSQIERERNAAIAERDATKTELAAAKARLAEIDKAAAKPEPAA